MRTHRRPASLARWSAVALALVAGALAVPVSGGVAGAASSNTLDITATEYAYKMSGSPTPGNVQIVFKNAGVETHVVEGISLKPGVTLVQAERIN